MKNFNDKQLLAIELLARKDYENLTIEDIYKQVGCSRAVVFKWMKDEDFKRAVSKRSIELITDLAPVIYKTTADLLQSKDDRVRSKGIDVFLKSMDRAEQLRKEEEKKEEEIDINKFIEELDIYPTLKKANYDYKRYYNKCRKKSINNINIESIRLVESLKAIELLKSGMDEAEIEPYLNNYIATDTDKIKAIKLIAACLDLDIKKITVEDTE